MKKLNRFKAGCRGKSGGCALIIEDGEILYFPFIVGNQIFFLRIN